MTKHNNKTYKNKLVDAIGNLGVGVLALVGLVACTILMIVCTTGKKVLEQGEKLAEKGQTYSANEATESFAHAGSDTKEAYNLYKESKVEKETSLPSEEKVELIDEGYSSGSEKAKVTA